MKWLCNKLIVRVIVTVCLMVACGVANGQSDAFFNDWNGYDNRADDGMMAPPMPQHGLEDDCDTPLGHGLPLFVLFASLYLIVKKRRTHKAAAMLLVALAPMCANAQEVDVEWTVKPHAYKYNMTGFARVIVDNASMTNAQYEIGAFVGDECRGEALCNNVVNGYYQAALTIFGNDGDVLTFKVMDHNNNWVIFADCDDTLHFKANRYYADPYNPKEINLKTITYYFNGGAVDNISSYTLSNEKPVVKLPLRNCKVEVHNKANYVTGNTELKDVIVVKGGGVVIGAGSGLSAVETVDNKIGVNGIKIEAQAPQPGTKGDYWDDKFSSVGSLVTVSSGVSGIMETYLDNSATEHDWHIISSPVANQLIYDAVIESEFAPEKGDDFYLWDETAATWCNIKADGFSTSNQFHNLNNNSFNFIPGRGYVASYANTNVKSYKGLFNHGDVTVGMTKTELIDGDPNPYEGFNLIGNPYPSFLDWESFEGWDRSRIFGYNSTDPKASACVMWIYNEDEGNYSVYVQGGGGISTLHATQYIAPGQGFFVKATETGDFTMRDAARTNEHDKSGFMKNQRDAVKIRVENKTLGADEVVLALSDNEMKIEKLFSISETAPAMYFKDDKGMYSIILNENLEKTMSLCLKAKQIGKYTISLNRETSGFDFVELEDSFTGQKVNLMVEDYTFYSSKDDNENRFKLNLRIDQNQDQNQEFAYQNGDMLIIKGKGDLQIIDVLGRTIIEKQLTGDETFIGIDNINKGMNIIRLGDKTQKMVIR